MTVGPRRFRHRAQRKRPGVSRAQVWRSGEKSLRAALGRPGAGAIAGARDPGAGSARVGHMAGAFGALAAARNGDGDGAVCANGAGDIERSLARIADQAVADAHRVAVSAIALALLG